MVGLDGERVPVWCTCEAVACKRVCLLRAVQSPSQKREKERKKKTKKGKKKEKKKEKGKRKMTKKSTKVEWIILLLFCGGQNCAPRGGQTAFEQTGTNRPEHDQEMDQLILPHVARL